MAMLNNQMVIVIIVQSLGRKDLTAQSMSRSLGHYKIHQKPERCCDQKLSFGQMRGLRPPETSLGGSGNFQQSG